MSTFVNVDGGRGLTKDLRAFSGSVCLISMDIAEQDGRLQLCSTYLLHVPDDDTCFLYLSQTPLFITSHKHNLGSAA